MSASASSDAAGQQGSFTLQDTLNDLKTIAETLAVSRIDDPYPDLQASNFAHPVDGPIARSLVPEGVVKEKLARGASEYLYRGNLGRHVRSAVTLPSQDNNSEENGDGNKARRYNTNVAVSTAFVFEGDTLKDVSERAEKWFRGTVISNAATQGTHVPSASNIKSLVTNSCNLLLDQPNTKHNEEREEAVLASLQDTFQSMPMDDAVDTYQASVEYYGNCSEAASHHSPPFDQMTKVGTASSISLSVLPNDIRSGIAGAKRRAAKEESKRQSRQTAYEALAPEAQEFLRSKQQKAKTLAASHQGSAKTTVASESPIAARVARFKAVRDQSLAAAFDSRKVTDTDNGFREVWKSDADLYPALAYPDGNDEADLNAHPGRWREDSLAPNSLADYSKITLSLYQGPHNRTHASLIPDKSQAERVLAEWRESKAKSASIDNVTANPTTEGSTEPSSLSLESNLEGTGVSSAEP